jgi:hypothetical protein
MHSSSLFLGLPALDNNFQKELRELKVVSNRSRNLTDALPERPAWKIGSGDVQDEIKQTMAFGHHERACLMKAYLLAVRFEGKFSVSRQVR